MLNGIEQSLVEHYLLSGLVGVAEAQELLTRTRQGSVLRDLRDSLLLHLCAHPLQEAGPRSGLAELQAFGAAANRERTVWELELNDAVGRHLMQVAEGTTSENRDQRRWDVLLPLGAPVVDLGDPSFDNWQAAINVYTRVVAARAADGLIHPVVAADSIASTSLSERARKLDVLGVRTIKAAGELFDQWSQNRSQRNEIAIGMMDVFRSAAWKEV